MLDAAKYIKLAWDAISDATIKNAFNKAELLTLKGGAHKEVNVMADLLCSFKALNIPIDESTLDEFVHVDDKNSEKFSHEILVDVNEVLESIQATNDNKDENVHTVVELCAPSPAPIGNEVIFLEHIYNKVFEVEDRLLCPDIQIQAGNYYNELRNFFQLFQQILRQVILDVKRKKKPNVHQLTIHDVFK